jgi:hypothetical protein
MIQEEKLKILISGIRKAMPSIIAQEIVGVQYLGSSEPIRAWQSYLAEVDWNYFLWTEMENKSRDDSLALAQEFMQARCPGPYCVVEKPLGLWRVTELELKFNDPHEQTIWQLRWS